MKRQVSFLAFALILMIGSSYGQGYTFKVLANKGSNKIKAGSEWQVLKTGASLQDGDELMVSENAYLGLVHASGKTLELKSPGNHKIKDLAAKVSAGGSSVASKYADFVLSKMSAEGKKNRLSATGAVHRGESAGIHIYMPSSVGVYNEAAIIRWDSVEGRPSYTVTLKNMFDDVLGTIETAHPSIELNLSDEKISKENVVLLTVAAKGEGEIHSGTYAIKRLSKDDAARVKSNLNDLMADVDQETALNKYILAGFYEENNLLVDALTSYEQAIKLAPEVDSFKDAYLEFLLRNRLSE